MQTLCITRVSALCTKCLHRPIVILYIYIIFMCLDCVLSITSIEMVVFLLKIKRYAQQMEDPRKIVLCDSNLVIIDTQKK